MARKRKSSGKRRKNFVVLPFEGELGLGTLADKTVTSLAITGLLDEDFYCISVDLHAALRDATAGQGPLRVGIRHGDYTNTEVKEHLEITVTGPDDLIENERARRMVRKAGQFPVNEATEVLNDGKPIRVPVRWTTGNGKTLNAFVYNSSGAALTTGAVMEFYGDCYGRWIR